MSAGVYCEGPAARDRVVGRRLEAIAPANAPPMALAVAAQVVVGTALSWLQWWVEVVAPLSAEQMGR